ncbi:hypothetical protein [Novosphingobium sp. ST904]|uniref:hypothetical protein n=1 Tax=Novosphingobium sp. ST904 TaxID=1684385 RepID=UPI0006C8A491|nr:hypothetical protein [Novosphingobium sp. ST904]KPH59179.1 hypothetical protein ADT71_23850 [Novosphingobium sp. ST904]TCM37732.1 hypothetical protein EDF59_110128 [Novosphingobium sp. ST904]
MDTKISDLLKVNVDDGIAAFSTLSDDELAAFAAAEAAATNRKSLLKAIATEQEARAHTAKEQKIIALAADAGVRVFTDADVRALIEETKMEQNERIAALEIKLADAEAGTTAQEVAAQPRKLAVIGNAEGPCLRIAFTGSDDMTIQELPELEFQRGAFKFDHSRRVVSLEQPIVFPIAVRRTEITKAWLVGKNGDAAAVCEFISPLAVGGGTRAKINAGHLSFSEPKVDMLASAANAILAVTGGDTIED